MLWATIKFSLDRDKQAYANKVEGARKTTVLRESNRRDSNDTVQNTTMSYDKDNDKDNVKDRDKVEDMGKNYYINKFDEIFM